MWSCQLSHHSALRLSRSLQGFLSSSTIFGCPYEIVYWPPHHFISCVCIFFIFYNTFWLTVLFLFVSPFAVILPLFCNISYIRIKLYFFLFFLFEMYILSSILLKNLYNHFKAHQFLWPIIILQFLQHIVKIRYFDVINLHSMND